MLFSEFRAPEFAGAGLPPSALEGLLRMQFHAQDNGYRAEFRAAEDQIVCSAEEPIGRVLVDRGGEAIHLVDLGLTASHCGRGIGTLLLNSLIQEARDRRLPLQLSVRSGNPAVRLYTRLGFVVRKTDGMDVAMECRPYEVPGQRRS